VHAARFSPRTTVHASSSAQALLAISTMPGRCAIPASTSPAASIR